MPSNPKSPYASTFKTAIKRGTPASKVVEQIAKRRNTRPDAIFNSLHKAGLCHRQKFNGKWIYWPTEGVKTSATNAKVCQSEIWQLFIDWCIAGGHVKPQQLANNTGSQQEFMSYCRKFFNRQFSASVSKPKSRKRTASKPKTRKRTTVKSRKRTSTVRARKSTTRRTTARKSSTSRSSYKFPRTSTRKYRRAA